MSICREWLLHRQSLTHAESKLLLCRSWNCEHCQPIRKRQLMGLATSGQPNRFLTLTVNPAFEDSPEARLTALAKAWNIVCKRLRRRYKGKPIEFLAVVEETKRGEPHLHILLHSPFIPHDLISQYMAELINAPIVDIRSIKSSRQIANYVAKYISKKPAQFGSHKRYWQSRAYDQSDPEPNPEPTFEGFSWHVWTHGRAFLRLFWQAQGFTLLSQTDERDYALHRSSLKGALESWPK
jgi:hypothetical protein